MAWNNNNYTFGNPSKRAIKALKTVIAIAKTQYPILENVYVGIKKLPADAPQIALQVIIQPIGNEDLDNGFTRWQQYGVSVYARNIEEVEELTEVIEGCLGLIRGQEGIRYTEILMSGSETENSFSALSRNQSTLEEWRLITFEANLSPVQFLTSL